MRERKAIVGGITLDPAKEGTFRSIISTLNVIDSDKDVTVPGAFKQGQQVRLAQWGHNWSGPVIGRGTIDSDTTKTWADGVFNLKMVAGRENYESVKFDAQQSEKLQEWSYGYDVLDSEAGQFEGQDVRFLKSLDVIEISPVMLGAGIGTGTESIKGLKFADHAAVLLDDVAAFIDRARDLKRLRAKEGRTLSETNRARLSSLLESWTAGLADLTALLQDTAPKPKEPDPKADDLIALRLRQMRDEARSLGIPINI